MSFRHYYVQYLQLHQNPTCRRLHLLGLACALTILLWAACFAQWWLCLLAPIAGYAFSWIGHFFFEKNVPATWRNPWHAFRADLHMTYDVFRGRIKL
jgi:hypothetical protein